MVDLSPALRGHLETIFRALASQLHRAQPFQVALDAERNEVRIVGDTIHIPARHEAHWRRFHTIPPELVRDAAFQAAKVVQMPAPDEADCHAFAEKFVRDELLWSD